jgi:outer membrane murein-binding lipoprotein Lpp
MEEPAMDVPAGDEIELDVTELVKGSEAAKESADAANSKIEQLMDMVNKLENQLTTMSTISSKIDALEKEIEVRNPTPKEKLEMRSLDSYPYNIKLTDFWAEKGDRYETGAEEEKPKEYILKQSDIDNDYVESDIEDSFNADDYEKKNNF